MTHALRKLTLPALGVLGVLGVLGACAAPRAPAVVAPPPPPTGQGPAQHDFTGWRAWQKMNPARFRSRGHGYVWVDVFAEPVSADAYQSPAAPIPVGLTVVVVGYEGRKGDVVGLTAMVKMPAGYDPTGGDWYYASVDAAGRIAAAQGPLRECIACHRNAARDHLFGVGSEVSE